MISWIQLSFLLLFILVATDLVYRKLIDLGYDAISLVFWSSTIATALFVLFFALWKPKLKLPSSPSEALMLLTIGALFCIGFVVLRMAQIKSPNMALVSAISYSSVVVTLVLLHYLYGDKLTLKTLLGGVFIITGVFLCTM